MFGLVSGNFCCDYDRNVTIAIGMTTKNKVDFNQFRPQKKDAVLAHLGQQQPPEASRTSDFRPDMALPIPPPWAILAFAIACTSYLQEVAQVVMMMGSAAIGKTDDAGALGKLKLRTSPICFCCSRVLLPTLGQAASSALSSWRWCSR